MSGLTIGLNNTGGGGATDPLAPADGEQNVTGDLAVSGVVLIDDGAVGAPGLAFGSEATTGIFTDAGTRLNITSDGVAVARFSQLGNALFSTTTLYDNAQFGFGSSADATLSYRTAQTPDALVLGVGSESNSMIVCERADISFDFAHPLQTNPTVFVHSANQATDEYISIHHDQTNAVVSGTGALDTSGLDNLLAPDGSLTDAGISFGGSNGSYGLSYNGTMVFIAGSLNRGLFNTTGMLLNDNTQYKVGTSADASWSYRTAQTPDAAVMGLGADSNGLIICQQADIDFDFAHALQTDPTVFVHSANQATDEWISISHDQTNGAVNVGTGSVQIQRAGSTIFNIGASGGSSIQSGGAGSAGAPIYTFSSDSNTGIYRSSTDHLAITTSGTMATEWDHAGNMDVVGDVDAAGGFRRTITLRVLTTILPGTAHHSGSGSNDDDGWIPCARDGSVVELAVVWDSNIAGGTADVWVDRSSDGGDTFTDIWGTASSPVLTFSSGGQNRKDQATNTKDVSQFSAGDVLRVRVNNSTANRASITLGIEC